MNPKLANPERIPWIVEVFDKMGWDEWKEKPTEEDIISLADEIIEKLDASPHMGWAATAGIVVVRGGDGGYAVFVDPIPVSKDG